MEASNYAVTPADLDALTLDQLWLYGAKSKMSEAEAIEYVKRRAAKKREGLTDEEFYAVVSRLYL